MKDREYNVIVGGVCMFILCLIILAVAFYPSAFAQTINPGEQTTVRCTSCPPAIPCPTCPPPVVCPSPAPVPTASPAPQPTLKPAPVPTPAPTQPPTEGCTHTITPNAIPQFLSSASPGNVGCVTDGTYTGYLNFTRSGTAANWITLKAIGKAVINNKNRGENKIDVNASYVRIKGFEITGGYDGIKIYRPHVEILDNYIHHNKYQGVLIVSTGNVTVKGNRIEYNGTTGYCNDWGSGGQWHCHGVYASNFPASCAVMSDINVIDNEISYNPGAGIIGNSSDCKGPITLNVSGNKLINNGSGFRAFVHITGKYENNLCRVEMCGSKPCYPPSAMPSDTRVCFIQWGSSVTNGAGNQYQINVPGFRATAVY